MVHHAQTSILWQFAVFIVLLSLAALASQEASALALAQLPGSSIENQVHNIKLKPVVFSAVFAIFAVVIAAIFSAWLIAPGRTRFLGLNRKVHSRGFVGLAITCVVFAIALWLAGLFASPIVWVNFRFFGGITIFVAGTVATFIWVRNSQSLQKTSPN